MCVKSNFCGAFPRKSAHAQDHTEDRKVSSKASRGERGPHPYVHTLLHMYVYIYIYTH